jgi:hypothetical protein
MLSRGNCNLRSGGLLILYHSLTGLGKKQLKGGMGVGVTIFLFSRCVV